MDQFMLSEKILETMEKNKQIFERKKSAFIVKVDLDFMFCFSWGIILQYQGNFNWKFIGR